MKRKLEYKHSHRKELIDPDKLIKSLQNLKESGHPYYQDFDDFDSYKERCKKFDETGHDLLFGACDADNYDGQADEENCTDDISPKENTEPEDNSQDVKDSIRKHQFDHNRNSCMTNNYPEMSVDENGKKSNETLSFAPAEGNRPTNLQEEKDWDIKSWPALLQNGKFGLHYKRKTKLSEQQYFCQRILHRDNRFSSSPGYIFAAAAYIEQKQLSSKL